MKIIDTIQSFHFSIGGYNSSSNVNIIITKTEIKYALSLYPLGGNDEYILKLNSDKQMQKFILDLNKLDVLGWKRRYDNDVCDGTQWELKIKYNEGKTKTIYGSNKYPGETNNEEISYSPIFKELLVIIQDFINEPGLFELD